MQHTKVVLPNEKKTLLVIFITILTMVGEICYGYLTSSMALLADGYHMGTHVLALGLTFVAYLLIRSFAHSPLFPNGTHKIGTLAAYTSSLFLGVTGVWILFESIERVFNPLSIRFDEAILVATIGLVVNAFCILIMGQGHDHLCEHSHGCCHKEDYNFKAAYYHILADALTSVLAIIALFMGKYLNIFYLDSFVGVLGGLLILKWAARLLKNTVCELVDMKR